VHPFLMLFESKRRAKASRTLWTQQNFISVHSIMVILNSVFRSWPKIAFQAAIFLIFLNFLMLLLKMFFSFSLSVEVLTTIDKFATNFDLQMMLCDMLTQIIFVNAYFVTVQTLCLYSHYNFYLVGTSNMFITICFLHLELHLNAFAKRVLCFVW